MRHYTRTSRIAHEPRASGGTVMVKAPIGSLINASSHEVNQIEIRRLKEAAEIVRRACADVASLFSRRIPKSLTVKANERGIYIEGGGPTAPQAYSFDPPRNPPVYHPLFAPVGSERYRHGKWYAQPYRPFLEIGAAMSIDRAAEAFARVIDDWFKESGL